MGLADFSLPKTNEAEHEGVLFCTVEEGVRQTVERSAGKVLLLSDDLSLSEFATSPRAISVVFDGDALPLFAMPDGVSRVIASGGKQALLAARYFAEVRRIPCTLFPQRADLCGVFERSGEILLSGERMTVPLAQGELICDMERLSSTLGAGYARILLTRLAKFETDALNAFGMERTCAAIELPADAEEIIRFNAEARRAERDGAYCGEGAVLASLLKEEPFPEWSAYRLLTALYAAFFERGKPRRYLLPDYKARAESAGVPYAEAIPPTREQYVHRAMTLERIRARFISRIRTHLQERETLAARLKDWYGAELPRRGWNTVMLKKLPEYAPGGLTAIIRDFGLMDWENDKGRIVTMR